MGLPRRSPAIRLVANKLPSVPYVPSYWWVGAILSSMSCPRLPKPHFFVFADPAPNPSQPSILNRSPAIRLVANKLFSVPYLLESIQDFAVKNLRKACQVLSAAIGVLFARTIRR